MVRATLRWSLVVLEVLLAAGAFYGGILLVRDPTGGLLQMPARDFLHEGSLFRDFFVPGMVLLVANGLFPLVVVAAELTKARWAGLGHVAVGCVLTGWMLVQVSMMGMGAPIQVVFLLFGLVLLALSVAKWALDHQGPRQGPLHA